MLTKGWHVAATFRTVVFVDWLVRRLLGRRGQPPLRELRATLRGEAGPVPTSDWRPWLVMPASSDWSAGERRQHCLAGELAPSRRVLYADPPGRRARWRFVVRRIGPSLWHAVPPTLLPLGGHLPFVNWLNRRFVAVVLRSWLDQWPGPRVLWLDDADAVPLVGRFREDAVVFDADVPSRAGDRGLRRWWRRRELRTAVWRADLVLASSPRLPARLPASRRPPVVVRNACDPARFTVDGPVADWVEALAAPRLCYPGRLDDPAFDADLLSAVARHRPDWTFLLCGRPAPTGKRPVADLTALGRLTTLPNVRLVGAIRFGAMPALLRACDVGILPTRIDAATDQVLPKHLFEYLAVGKPVVATSLPALRELEGDGLVHLAADPAGFEAAVEKALSGWSPSAVAARRAVAEQNSWAVRGAQVRALLDQLEGGRQ
jgi:glycosyltransferase involved in cell wall biosynthesis